MKKKGFETTAATVGVEFVIGDDKFVVGICKCKGVSGNWICTTHVQSFANQFQKDCHISAPGKHVLAWNCHRHGPVQP